MHTFDFMLLLLFMLLFQGGYGSSGFSCEQDEYAELVKQIKDSGIVKDHHSFLRTYRNTFKGKEAVDWLVQTKQVGEFEKLHNVRRWVNVFFLLFKRMRDHYCDHYSSRSWRFQSPVSRKLRKAVLRYEFIVAVNSTSYSSIRVNVSVASLEESSATL